MVIVWDVIIDSICEYEILRCEMHSFVLKHEIQICVMIMTRCMLYLFCWFSIVWKTTCDTLYMYACYFTLIYVIFNWSVTRVLRFCPIFTLLLCFLFF